MMAVVTSAAAVTPVTAAAVGMMAAMDSAVRAMTMALATAVASVGSNVGMETAAPF